MTNPIAMPNVGFDVETGTVIRWLKAEGEAVAAGEPVVEVETEKVTLEVESPRAGVLLRILVPDGADAGVGETIGYVGEPGEEVPAGGPQPGSKTPTSGSPAACHIARQQGIDLREVRGTGPGGRALKADVLEHLGRAREGGGAAESVSPMRQAIARLVAASKQEIPHFYATTSIEMNVAADFRRRINQDVATGAKVGINDIITKAVAVSLARVPALNAWYVDDRAQPQSRANIGIAVATESGLVVPVLRDCQGKSLAEVARGSAALVARAREGRLRPEEFSGGTFSITNLGMFKVDWFVAIIHPPQVGILAVGRAQDETVVKEGQVASARVMRVTLSCDHRAVDGADAARFLGELKSLLESPAALLT